MTQAGGLVGEGRAAGTTRIACCDLHTRLALDPAKEYVHAIQVCVRCIPEGRTVFSESGKVEFY